MQASEGSALGLVAAPVLWGGNFLVGDMLADTLPSVWTNLMRWLIALIVLTPFCAGSVWAHRKVLLQHVKAIALSAFLGVTLFNTLLYTALGLTSVNLAAITFAVAPFMILVLSTLARRRLPKTREIFAASIAMAGIVLLQLDALRHGVPALGVALVLLAALTWAGYCMAVQGLSVPAPAIAVYFVQIVVGSRPSAD
jgi:drug/metabolite transporter (DMT)-like permease